MNPLIGPDEIHFMFDLETLSTEPDAAVTEIGCCLVYPQEDSDVFHVNVLDTSGHRDPETMKWRHENNLPWVIAQDGAMLAHIAVQLLYRYVHLNSIALGKVPAIWCNGTDFDIPIIKLLARRSGIDAKPPWKYSAVRDLRTLLAIFPEFRVPKETVKHNALDDAIQQAETLRKIIQHAKYIQGTYLNVGQ